MWTQLRDAAIRLLFSPSTAGIHPPIREIHGEKTGAPLTFLCPPSLCLSVARIPAAGSELPSRLRERKIEKTPANGVDYPRSAPFRVS